MAETLDTTALIARLRVLRRTQRLSARALAERSGIPAQVIANMETGRRTHITYAELRAWCAAIGHDVVEVVDAAPIVLTSA